MSVVEGDQETLLDAERIGATGARVVQVNTGAGCHLDATMLARAMAALAPPPGSVMVVENVGNLVCPALFDLGEAARVVVMSVTEGADKPLKYPHMFRTADLVLLNKVDLLPYVDFDVATWTAAVRAGAARRRGALGVGDPRRRPGHLVRVAAGGDRVAARGHRHLGVALQEHVQHVVGALQLLHLVGEQGQARRGDVVGAPGGPDVGGAPLGADQPVLLHPPQRAVDPARVALAVVQGA